MRVAITDRFAHSPNTGNPPTAPHADSRAMAFDAANHLIEGDDGGIYKQTNPAADTKVRSGSPRSALAAAW